MAEAEQWRGECIQIFAELEQTVEDLLLALAAAPRRGCKVRTGEQVSCAFGHLEDLTAGSGAFANEGRAVSRSLQALKPDFEWRAHLTHGVLAVWEGKAKRRLLTLKHRAPGGGPLRMHALQWIEAIAMRDRLKDGVRDLKARSGSLKAALGSAN